MKRVSLIIFSAILLLSVNAQAGGFMDALKKSVGEVAEDLKKDVKYTVDQTIRNAFPALKVAGEPEKTPAGFKNEVVVFGFESCPYCVKVENLLKKHRIPYKDMDVQRSKVAKKKFKEIGGRGVPVTIIGEHKLSGWSEEKILALLKQQGFM